MSELIDLLKKFKSVKVIDNKIDYSAYCPIDLSENNTELSTFDYNSSTEFEKHINHFLNLKNAKVAYGGYLETRAIYKRSNVFKNNIEEERNIHLGLDLWCPAGTSVLAALDGEIHSFQDNNNWGDYGPTIILKHTFNSIEFYTLYGHLSRESLVDKTVGQKITKGQEIAHLGTNHVNGDYAPHLHFQIIHKIDEKKGDYAGVCNQKNLDFYKMNCPDPELLLQITSIC